MTALTVPPQPAVRLFCAAFLTLFLELVLIRYLAGSVWNMGYFPNLVLLGVFIGMGVGFVGHQSIAERHSPVLLQLAAYLLSSLVIFLYCIHPVVPGFSQWMGSIGGEVYFTASPGASSAWDYVIFLSFYMRPYQYRAYRQLPPAQDVLVIGAGAGNDVAAALLSGASRVDAVEIDPVIADLGRQYHPARPYQDYGAGLSAAGNQKRGTV